MAKLKKSYQNPQAKYRRETFDTPCYWNINYTERYVSGQEKDFKTVIFAKSYRIAVHILETRLREDDPLIKLKSVQGFMFHKGYRSDAVGPLKLKHWEQIRKSSFPNENNFLFKVEIPRKAGKTNRFNKTDLTHLQSIGFKKGESNWSKRNRKGKTLPLEERANKIYRGHWIDWDPSLRQSTKYKLIDALLKSDNNRTHAAKHLGLHRNKLYKLFQKFPEVDWKVDYPPPSPPRPPSNKLSEIMKVSMARRMEEGEVPFRNCHSPETVALRIANMTKAKRVKRKAHLKEMIPVLDQALHKTKGNRTKAGQLLDLSPSVFNKLLRQTKDKVDWAKKYPSKFANKRYESSS